MVEDKIGNAAIVIIIVGIIFSKLMGWITWPWLWITSIIWIPLLIGVLIAIIFVILMLIEKKENKNERY